LAVFGLGSLLHFVHGWTSGSSFVAWFASVDESVWEHVKLLLGLLAAMAFMPAVFYVMAFSVLSYVDKPDLEPWRA
jgi:hypothetical protein